MQTELKVIEKQHTKYPKIGKFKDVFVHVNKAFVFGESKIIDFVGSVKLHGTNAAVCRKRTLEGYIDYALSRENVISVEKDNAGFAFFHETKHDLFGDILNQAEYNLTDDQKELFPTGYLLTIFGEWCGGSIQKNVALNQLTKRFVVFGLKLSDLEKDTVAKKPSIWLDHSWIGMPESGIHNISKFKSFNVTIDFDKPATALEEINALTLQVELECPFSKEFGASGTGEGIVWAGVDASGNILRFKSKGEKHSGKSETKVKPATDLIKLENVNQFAEYAVTDGRITQAIQSSLGIGNEHLLTLEHIGDIIKWVRSDIASEEINALIDSGLELKDVLGAVCKRTKDIVIDRINKF